MLSKNEQKIHRSTIFRHLDGIGTAPSALILFKKGILDYLIKNGEASLSDITENFEPMKDI